MKYLTKIRILKLCTAHKTLWLLLVLLFVYSEANAQYAFRKKWTFNVNAGLSSYYGSLSQYKADPIRKFLNESRPAIGISLSKHINPLVEIQTQFLTGGLASEERDSATYYKGSFMEFNINGRVNIINIILGESKDRKAHVYVTLGGGVVIINSQLYNYPDEENVINENPVEVISTRFVLPYGIGFSYKLNDNIDLTLDISRRLLNTEILKTNFDYYNYTAIGLNYNFDFPRGFKLQLKRKRYAYVEHDDKALNKYMRKKNKWRKNPGPLVKKHHKRRPKRTIRG